MPIYDYLCQKCGHRFEKIQKFSDAPVKKCPECGGAVERLISAPAVQFKGSGWYVTDYARKAQDGGKKSAESKADGAASESKDSGAKDNEPAKTGKSDKKPSAKGAKD